MMRVLERTGRWFRTTPHIWLTCVVLTVCVPIAAPAQRAGAGLTEIPRGALKPPSLTNSTDDLDGILARRTLRVLVVPNLTNYFIDRGRERGITYDSFMLLGNFLERTRQRQLTLQSAALSSTQPLKLHVVFVPVTRDKIFKALMDGRGDVAAANLTVTDSRARIVDFTSPLYPDVNEIIMSGPGAPPLNTLDDLSGQTVHVRRQTSYYESLASLNDRFRSAGKPAMRLALLPDVLENEDKLEMLNAGVIQIAVLEAPLYELWRRVMPNIRAHPQLVVRKAGSVAWAVRKGNRRLLAALNEFLATDYPRNSLSRQLILARYLKSERWLRPAYGSAEIERYHRTLSLFRRYSDQYGFDYLLVMALAFQESGLDQSFISPKGAIGLMQVMPATGREMRVGDIRLADPNIHAGVRYLRRLMDLHFAEPQLTVLDRMMFVFAAYNAGPSRINRLRDEAARLGLNRDKWFGNVELVVADRVGLEPVHYVGNVLKYYVAYSRVDEVERQRARARQRLN